MAKKQKMHDNVPYPNMEIICRLCLKEGAGTAQIFQQDKSEKHSNMSIPIRIMSCAALEVQVNDGLPPMICSECRYQLEKSYLFRKQSQLSDTKLRKHIRLLGAGKVSKVFLKNPDEDDDEEDEFQDSLAFIRDYEGIEDQMKSVILREELKLENDKELLRQIDAIKAKCKEDLLLEIGKLKVQIREETEREFEEVKLPKLKNAIKAKCKEDMLLEIEQLKVQIREETEKEFEEVKLPKLKEECLQVAKDALRDEMREECRKEEVQVLLDDLQTYLRAKQTTKPETIANNTPLPQSPKKDMPKKNPQQFSSLKNAANLDQEKPREKIKPKPGKNIVKSELILSDHMDMDDEDDESDNFLIYDTDEVYEMQKKSETASIVDIEETFADEHEHAEEEDNNDVLDTDDEYTQKSTTSYRIDDSENGEINLKESNETVTHHQSNEDDNVDPLQDSNIMIFNIAAADTHEDDQMEIVDYSDEYEPKVEKAQIIKGKSIKRCMPTDLSSISKVSKSFNTTTTSTIETTLVTKTYVSSTQRITDTPKTFKCNDCPMDFSTKYALDRHLRTHRKIEETGVTFKCPQCFVVVSCSSALRRHMFVHYEKKPFVCSICGKSFVQKEILKRHMQTHTGIKPHKCSHCDRAFAQRINLKQHINHHHSEDAIIRQHQCHLCPKRFNHASGLSRHLTSHSGLAFQCSECERTFGDRSSIKRHIINKHGGKVKEEEKN